MWLKCLLQRGFIRRQNLRDDGPQTGKKALAAPHK
jgi:hypothetical protein